MFRGGGALIIKNAKRGKEKPKYNGITFDSDLELRYYRDVLLPAFEVGEIDDLQVHPTVILAESVRYMGKKKQPVRYTLDFKFTGPCGREVWVDIKGFATSTHNLKRRLFQTYHHDKVMYWVAYSKMDGGWIEYDRLQAARRKRKKAKGA